ncbi:LysR family transcriptional regulator [Stenotrophomonas sp. 24(2023)]|uniref:LysR family transcriptional regulator n=1 Tax=Stenotrophomonas sp. 24(2023) TaxID=3068324 RepID=UPI0027DF0A89|nr:LysR family transcriptional regulator [Stenotrophomonas sp. 24(2023)]WMJ69447.1 LysR family transcriptional regulator [Stenotrophomonas sp. 24(2023)]
MDNPAHWDLYRSFLAVLEDGSLSAAARSLGLSQPTVGRHVSALEAALGLALFTRSQGGLLPTDMALTLRPHAEAMRSHAAALRRAAESQGSGVQGTVRIAASEVIGMLVLPAMVARLQQQHPGLRIELVLGSHLHNLLRREADIAVRMTRPAQDQLVARRVGTISVGLFAHRDYLAQHPAPATLQALGTHRLIGFDQDTPFLRSARRALPQWDRDAFATRVDSDVAQWMLIRAGAGIGFCQHALAAQVPDLQPVLADQLQVALDTWITLHEDLRTSQRCRVVFDALVETLAAHADAGSAAAAMD